MIVDEVARKELWKSRFEPEPLAFVGGMVDLNRVEVRTFPDEKSWIEGHFGIITSSRAAGALGLDEKEYSTPLRAYYQVRGELDPVPETPAMRLGKKSEPQIAVELGLETGRQHFVPVAEQDSPYFLLVRKDMPWLGATPDRFYRVPGLGGGFGVSELKLVTTPRAAAEWDEAPPLRHRIQVHVQAVVSGAIEATVAGLIYGGELKWRDEPTGDVVAEFRAEMLEALETFHRRCLKGQRPDPKASDVRMIREKFEGIFTPKRIKLPATMSPLLKQWNEAQAAIDHARELLKIQGAKQDEIEARVRLALGEFAQGRLPTGEVFYREETQIEAVMHKAYTKHRFGVFSQKWR